MWHLKRFIICSTICVTRICVARQWRIKCVVNERKRIKTIAKYNTYASLSHTQRPYWFFTTLSLRMDVYAEQNVCMRWTHAHITSRIVIAADGLQDCAVFHCVGVILTARTTPACSSWDFPIFHAMATPTQPLHSYCRKIFANVVCVCTCACAWRNLFLSFINISIENVQCEDVCKYFLLISLVFRVSFFGSAGKLVVAWALRKFDSICFFSRLRDGKKVSVSAY